MPKILIFNNIWIFVFYPTDMYENRAHVHVGKKDMENLCKIWLDPTVEVVKQGDLSLKQQKEVLEITLKYKAQLLEQWAKFVKGKTVKVIKAK
jgi:hypothetical protein